MQVTDTFGVTREELETVKNEAARLAVLGYKVPNIEIKWLGGGYLGMASLVNGTLYIHPNGNLKELKFTVAHEIGHFNDPSNYEGINIWDDNFSFDNETKRREDYADWFATNI